MDYRNDMRRDPYSRPFVPAFAAANGAVRRGDSCGIGEGAQRAINTLPLAMVYVPEQRFTGVKKPAAALEAGTLFDALDKPFLGHCSRGGRR